MEETELRKVSPGEHLRSLSPSQVKLLNRVEVARGLDIGEVSCSMEEVRQLIGAGLLRLEVMWFRWGMDFRIVPAIASASGADA